MNNTESSPQRQSTVHRRQVAAKAMLKCRFVRLPSYLRVFDIFFRLLHAGIADCDRHHFWRPTLSELLLAVRSRRADISGVHAIERSFGRIAGRHKTRCNSPWTQSTEHI